LGLFARRGRAKARINVKAPGVGFGALESGLETGNDPVDDLQDGREQPGKSANAEVE